MSRQRIGNPSRRECYHHSLRRAIGRLLPHRGLALEVDDQRVRWTPRLLVVCAILMAWMPARALKDAFAAAREAVVAMYSSRRRPGQTPEGFANAMRGASEELLGRVVEALQGALCRQAGAAWRWGKWVVLGVDGSRVECPMTRRNEATLGCAGKKKTTPQLFVTTIFHVFSGLPWTWRRGGGRESERNHLRELIVRLPPSTLLLADAGFVGYELLRGLMAAGHDFLVRAGSNVTLLTDLGFAVQRHGDVVYLWPQARQKFDAPLVLRLVTVGAGRQAIYLLTSVMNKSCLSDRQIGRLYRLRWGVEVLYRSFKQTMEHRKMRSDTPEGAQVELDWAMVGLWMLGLMSGEARGRHSKERWSVAASLRVVRQAVRRARVRCSRDGMRTELRQAVLDRYRRVHPKQARHWPHKKTEQPPGKPCIRMATRREVQAAQKVRELRLAG